MFGFVLLAMVGVLIECWNGVACVVALCHIHASFLDRVWTRVSILSFLAAPQALDSPVRVFGRRGNF